MCLPAIRFFLQKLRGEAGTAAMEFGLIMPMLIILVIGVIEVGSAVSKAMQAQNAAEAGAHYASKNGLDPAGISAAILAATGGSDVTVGTAPTEFCGCPTASGLGESNCELPCADGTGPGLYLRISAQITHTPIVSLPHLLVPTTFTGEAVVRIY